MSKRTKISALAGRVIESCTVYHDDGTENPVSLELRLVGGLYFCFDLKAEVVASGVALLATDDDGTLRNERRRTFTAKGAMCLGMDD